MTQAFPRLWKRMLGARDLTPLHVTSKVAAPQVDPPPAFTPVQIDAGQKRVCFWGAPSHFQPGNDWRVNLARTGANTGNLFIGNGLFESTVSSAKAYGLDFDHVDPTRLHEDYDVIFIPASNFLNARSDFQPAFEFLSRTKLPIFCFGLGSQHVPGSPLQLKLGTDRFIRLLSERSQDVGVRGDFTAELMGQMGLKNVSVVGCPSLLGISTLALERLGRVKPALGKIGVHFSNNVRGHALHPDAMRASENALFQRCAAENAYYVIQNEVEEFQLLQAIDRADDAAIGLSMAAIARTFGTTLSDEAFVNFMRHRLRVFFEVARWVSAMQTMTGSIGFRFHGTVAALLAGTPSLLLAHDMRTKELADFFHIPHISVDRAYDGHEMVEQFLMTDMRPFVRRMATVRIIWRHFAQVNGFTVAREPVELS